jgi:hypothetical protein
LKNGKEAARKRFEDIQNKMVNYPLDYFKFFIFLTQHPDDYEKKSDSLIELTKEAIRFYETATGKRYKPFINLTFYLLKDGEFAIWDEDERCYWIGKERVRRSKKISWIDLDLEAYTQLALKEAEKMFRGLDV